MPSGIYKHKLSQGFQKGNFINKGRIPWHKGNDSRQFYKCYNCKKKFKDYVSNRSGKKNFCTLKCRNIYYKIYFKKNNNPFYGKKHSKEFIKKQSKRLALHWENPEYRKNLIEKRSGKNSPQWKGGISLGENKQTYKNIKALERRAREINASGSFLVGEWENLKAQYNWTCPACKKTEPSIKLSIDHIIPLIKGGSNNIENIQPLCRNCNSKKHTKIIKYVF